MRKIPAVLLLLAALAPTTPLLAQGRLPRADFSGTLGWFSANQSEIASYDQWANRSLIGEVGAGKYWTPHWKTEVLVGASTETDVYGSHSIVIDGQPFYSPSNFTFSTRRLAVTQQYQFGNNQWFHPYLGVGIDGVWEHSARRDQAIYAYDQVGRRSVLVRPERDYPAHTDARAVPAAAAGFKSYITPHAFFRGDLRVTFSRRPDEVVLRFGFGVDF